MKITIPALISLALFVGPALAACGIIRSNSGGRGMVERRQIPDPNGTNHPLDDPSRAY
jgi:hypothetical protein